jgi:hypothetical protein
VDVYIHPLSRWDVNLYHRLHHSYIYCPLPHSAYTIHFAFLSCRIFSPTFTFLDLSYLNPFLCHNFFSHILLYSYLSHVSTSITCVIIFSILKFIILSISRTHTVPTIIFFMSSITIIIVILSIIPSFLCFSYFPPPLFGPFSLSPSILPFSSSPPLTFHILFATLTFLMVSAIKHLTLIRMLGVVKVPLNFKGLYLAKS